MPIPTPIIARTDINTREQPGTNEANQPRLLSRMPVICEARAGVRRLLLPGHNQRRRHRQTGHTRARTNAGVAALFTSDVVFATSASLHLVDLPILGGRRRRRPAISREQGRVNARLASMRALLCRLSREEGRAPSFARIGGPSWLAGYHHRIAGSRTRPVVPDRLSGN